MNLKRILLGLVAAVVGGTILVWIADFTVFHYRAWQNRAPYGTVTVNEYYAVQEKNNRVEYIYKSTGQQNCANALFPHSGFAPCWYARRHTERPVPI